MDYKAIRQAANLYLFEIASFLGVTTRMVYNYESGDMKPTASVKRLYGHVSDNEPAFQEWLTEKMIVKKD